MIKKIFLLFLFCVTTRGLLLAQKTDTLYFFANSCRWDSVGGKQTKQLKNKTGHIYTRFGTTIINIKGVAYNPCNLPAGLDGKKVLLSGVVFKNTNTDGKAIRLTELKVIADDQ